MPLVRHSDGQWTLQPTPDDESELEGSHPSFWDALPRYLSSLDPVFEQAAEVCEFEYLCALLGIKGVGYSNRDPFETTKAVIPLIIDLHGSIDDFATAKHLHLWLYGHAMEAAEPYNLLMNLIQVVRGERCRSDWFPPNKHGTPCPVGQKIARIRESANDAGYPSASDPLTEAWDRELRNGIFHADYALVAGDIYVGNRTLSNDDVLTRVNHAIAWHSSIVRLRELHLKSYEQPRVIDVHPGFTRDPDEKAVVIIRDGDGAVGLKDNWTQQELDAGHISFRMGTFYPDEIQILDADCRAATLPRRV